ncbi:MAG: hypothetical protein H7X71_03160, partial [Chitinophagales bacterium]|nr:hypothetical protein [Chitinophagales bacterium]
MRHTHTTSLLFLIVLGTSSLSGQGFTKIVSVANHYTITANNTSYSTTGCIAASGTYSMKFGTSSGIWTDHIQVLDNATTAAGDCFEQVPIVTNQIVKLRRVNNTMISGVSSCIWMEGSTPFITGGECNNRLPYKDSMDTLFSAGLFNAGTDNLFNNI